MTESANARSVLMRRESRCTAAPGGRNSGAGSIRLLVEGIFSGEAGPPWGGQALAASRPSTTSSFRGMTMRSLM